MQRRRKAALEPSNSVTAEDAILTALLEQRQAAAQCEEMAQNDEAWEDLHQLWRGPLTSSLLDLAADATAKTKVQRGTISAAEKNQALAEAQRRLERLDEESQRQRLGLKRRQKVAEAGRRELEKLVEGGTEFEHLAAEHREGLNHQQNNIKEVMASDVEPLEEIETWRQMVGLEELQAAAGKMSEQLATIEEGEEMAVENPEKRQKHGRTGPGGGAVGGETSVSGDAGSASRDAPRRGGATAAADATPPAEGEGATRTCRKGGEDHRGEFERFVTQSTRVHHRGQPW